MKYQLVFISFFATLVPALAQPPEPLEPETIKLTIHPAAAPVPALKYRLMPELRELKPGNAVLVYYRAHSPEWGINFRRSEMIKSLNTWIDNRRKLPPEELRVVQRDDVMLKQLDEAARRTYVDWEMAERLRKSGFATLLGDIQFFRTSGVLLAARSRFEMADKHFDKAVYSLETGMTFGRHVSQGATFVQFLIGVTITATTLEQVEELIQIPGSPNLYWALTELPTPYLDLRQSVGGERIILDSYFPGIRAMLDDPKAKPICQAQVEAMVDRLVNELGPLGASTIYGWQARVGLALIAAQVYPQARQFLLAQGRSEKDVDAMPVLQVALMYEVYNYDRYYDDMAKWIRLPYWQALPGIKRAEQKLKEAKAAGPSTGATLAALLHPAMQNVHLAAARTDRRIAALRIIEAIRLYAAAHEGKLPAALADIRNVPIPTDPVTGQAFEYTAKGNRATLYAGPPLGGEINPVNTLRYELTLER
jgi:hypothetical protein